TESERTLREDAVVEWRVDGAIRDTNVFASIDVDAVAVRVDLQIVYRQVINAGGQNREVPAMQNRDIANDYVAAKLKTNRFVSPSRLDCIARIRITKRSLRFAGARRIQRVVLLRCARLRAAANQTLAPNHSPTADRK